MVREPAANMLRPRESSVNPFTHSPGLAARRGSVRMTGVNLRRLREFGVNLPIAVP